MKKYIVDINYISPTNGVQCIFSVKYESSTEEVNHNELKIYLDSYFNGKSDVYLVKEIREDIISQTESSES